MSEEDAQQQCVGGRCWRGTLAKADARVPEDAFVLKRCGAQREWGTNFSMGWVA